MSVSSKTVYIHIADGKPHAVSVHEIDSGDPFPCVVNVDPNTSVIFKSTEAARTFVSALVTAMDEMEQAEPGEDGTRDSGPVMIFQPSEVF